MGMLLDPRIFLNDYALIAFWFVFILAVKIAVTTLAAKALKVKSDTALMVGLSIAQIGEFSFILALSGMEYQLITERNYQIFLSVSLLTMALTPFLLENKQRIVQWLIKRKSNEPAKT